MVHVDMKTVGFVNEPIVFFILALAFLPHCADSVQRYCVALPAAFHFGVILTG